MGNQPLVAFLEAAPSRWEAAVSKMYSARDGMHRDILSFLDDVKAEVGNFRHDVQVMRETFAFEGPFNPAAVTPGAWQPLGGAT